MLRLNLISVPWPVREISCFKHDKWTDGGTKLNRSEIQQDLEYVYILCLRWILRYCTSLPCPIRAISCFKHYKRMNGRKGGQTDRRTDVQSSIDNGFNRIQNTYTYYVLHEYLDIVNAKCQIHSHLFMIK